MLEYEDFESHLDLLKKKPEVISEELAKSVEITEGERIYSYKKSELIYVLLVLKKYQKKQELTEKENKMLAKLINDEASMESFNNCFNRGDGKIYQREFHNLLGMFTKDDSPEIQTHLYSYYLYLCAQGNNLQKRLSDFVVNTKIESASQLVSECERYKSSLKYLQLKDIGALSQPGEKLKEHLMNKSWLDARVPHSPLTNREYHALELLSIDNKDQLQEYQKVFLKSFIKDITGNLDYNRRLMSLLGERRDFLSRFRQSNISAEDEHREELIQLKSYTFKTRHILKLDDKLIGKLKKINEEIDSVPASTNQKISLKEFALIRDLSSQYDKTKALNEAGAFPSELFEKIKLCHDIHKKLSDDLKKNINLKGGSIAQVSIDKRKQVSKESFRVNFIKFFLTKYMHTARSYFYNNPEPHESHPRISHTYQKSSSDSGFTDEEFQLRDYLSCDIFYVNVEKLIGSDIEDLLINCYGHNYASSIQQKFKEKDVELLDKNEGNFKHVSASNSKIQVLRAIQSWLPFGHKQWKKNDFAKIHKEVYGKEGAKMRDFMMCSEYSARTLCASLIELNNVVLMDINKKRKDKGLQLLDASTEIIKNPFGAHEKFKTMHPSRLLKVLDKAGCLAAHHDNSLASKYIEKEQKRYSFWQRFKAKYNSSKDSGAENQTRPRH